MQEICHDLGVLHVGAVANGFTTRSRLFDTFQLKTCFDQQIQPLAHRPRKPWGLELRKPLLRLRRRGPEEPFGNLSFEISEVVSDLNRVRQSVLVAQIPPMRRVEARMGDGELQEAPGLLQSML